MTFLINPFRFGGGTPGWLPTDDASLVGWWDPSDTSTLTLSGSAVTSMADKSGFGRPASNSTGANRPTSGHSINGLNFLRYEVGGGNALFLTPLDHADFQFGTGDFYCVCVVHFDNVSKGVSAQNTVISKTFTGFEMLNYQGTAAGFVGGSGNAPGTLAISSATPYIFGLKRISGSVSIDINGTNGSATANTATASNIGQGIIFGLRPGASSATGLTGFMGPCHLCSSAAAYEKHQGYLAHRHGLAADLPGGHPYKAAPPPA